MTQTQKTKNEHYVPQKYLEKFTYDGERLFVFDKFTRKPYLTHIRNIASETYFYDVHPDLLQRFQDEVAKRGYPSEDAAIIERASDPQLVEHELSEIEAQFYKARDLLINTVNYSGVIKPEQKDTMAFFMTIQLLRTPETRRAIVEIQEKMMNQLLEDEELYAKYDQRNASLDHAAHMFNPEIQQKSMETLSKHIWLVGSNQTTLPLYTSDTPIVLKGHSARYREIGLGVPGIEIVFPLSPNHILILLDRYIFHQYTSQDCTIQPLSLERVQYYNRLQILRSYRQVYSQSKDFSLVEETCQRFPKRCNPNQTQVNVSWYRNRSDSSILHSQRPDPSRVRFEIH